MEICFPSSIPFRPTRSQNNFSENLRSIRIRLPLLLLAQARVAREDKIGNQEMPEVVGSERNFLSLLGELGDLVSR